MTTEEIEKQLADLKAQVEGLKRTQQEDKLSMIVFSGDLDKVLAAFVTATGAVAMGLEVVMYFTTWGTPLLRDKNKTVHGKDMMGIMFGHMLPKGAGAAKLSKLNMGGMGTSMMKSLMKKKNVASLEEMIKMAAELGVKIFIAEISMDLMGFKREEMIDYPGVEYVGVATFLEQAIRSKITLFL